MRLRTFESFWLVKNGLLHTYPSLQKDMAADIVVLGGGITGALMCYQLVCKGYKVLLLDKRDIAQGSTSATTSMLQYEIDVPLCRLKELIGEDGAVKCYKAGIEAIKKIENIIRDNKIDCGFEKKKSLYVAHSKRAARWLKEEYSLRKKHQLGVNWLCDKEIKDTYGIVSNGGILSDTAASIDAYKLAHALIKISVDKGLNVFDHTEAVKINCTHRNVELLTSEKKIVRARKIIFCTGYESLKYVDEKIADIITTYATISEENIAINSAWKDTLVWNTNEPYLYARTTEDNRLLVGGEDDKYTAQSLSSKTKNKKAERLEKQLKQFVPDINFIEDFSWAGAFAKTKDGLPYIGSYSKMPNTFFNLGFGGNGITFSIQGVGLIENLLKGQTAELLHYYRFGR